MPDPTPWGGIDRAAGDPFSKAIVVLVLWLSLPLVLRLAFLALAGAIGGALANHAIYTWCWFPRPISPWVRDPANATGAGNSWTSRIPIVGWLARRNEADRYGRAFWLRPLLIELCLAAALPLLYWFQCITGGLLPEPLRVPGFLAAQASWLNQVYFAHAGLILFMTAATFIDFDEQTIPDLITVPGTLLALLAGTASIEIFMPAVTPTGLVPVTFHAPWPIPLDSPWFGPQGLWSGLAIWSAWCFALADRRVILRRGWAKAAQYFAAGLVRQPTWKVLLSIWLVGLLAVATVWNFGGLAWLGMFTSLVGLAVGGGVVWAIRVVASLAMGVEAMGFGDVTLMAMIGAVLGWQAALAAFFLAPLAAIVIVLIQYLITREPRVPFGPYLCAGAVLTILFWDAIFNGWLAPNLAIGPILLWLSGSMLILMGALLFVWRLIKQSLLRR